MFSSWTRIVLPALAVSLAAAAWLRRSDASHPMPRLPVRRKPPTPRGANPSRASRLRRLQAPAPEVALPLSFWDAEADEDDPAEIPTAGLSFVSEASQSAALLDPGELEESGSMLHW
ncbi:MAG: hypothetical protein ABI895_01975 [Deltaproteobacteria bacterium]